MRVVIPKTVSESGYGFTRASVATYYDSSGVLQAAAADVPRYGYDPETGEYLGLIIEEASTNLLLRSEEFDDAYWTKSNSTISENASAAPDGSLTADALISNDGSTFSAVNSGNVVSPKNVNYTALVFVAPGSALFAYVQINAYSSNLVRCFINLTTGETSLVNLGNGLVSAGSAASVNVPGAGWIVKFTGAPNSSDSSDGIQFGVGPASSMSSTIFAGTGVASIHVWGAQLEQAASPSSYIKTTTAAATRAADVITGDMLSNVALDDYAIWAAGSYVIGDRVIYGIEVYECVANTSAEPTTSADWVRVGYTNRWRMFRDGRDSKTSNTEVIDAAIETTEIYSTVSLLGLSGSEARVYVEDDTDGIVYDETISLVDIGVGDWWEWHFLPYEEEDTAVFDGIPPYTSSRLNIHIIGATALSTVECGRVVYGLSRELGLTNFGTSIELLDYSTKERDGFGNLTLVPRRAINIVNYDVTVPTPTINFALRKLKEVSGIPALFIGDSDFSETVTYGVYRTVMQGISYPSISELTVQVEEF